MNTSTKTMVPGWFKTFVPKSLNVKVAEWLAENEFSENDINAISDGTTFADFKSCIEGQSAAGLDIVNTDKCSRFLKSGYMDSFLRDAIFDAIRVIR